MTRVNRRRAMTALAAIGAVTLAACSSGTSAGSGVLRVADVVRVGPYTQEFAGPLPAGAAQASVIEGFREAQVLWEKSENTGRLVAPVRDYVAGAALTHLTSATSADKSHDVVPAGTDRFFQTRVTALTSTGATITTCDDGSKFEQVNPHTGKVAAGYLPTPGEQYLFETWRMGLLDGRWAITGFSIAVLPSRAAEQCQPGVTGQGPSRLPGATALVRQMTAAMRAARSVHIAGTVREGGSPSGVNLSMTRSGQLFGQVSQGGHTFTVLALPGHFYLRITAGFLQVGRPSGSGLHTVVRKVSAVPGGAGTAACRSPEHGVAHQVGGR